MHFLQITLIFELFDCLNPLLVQLFPENILCAKLVYLLLAANCTRIFWYY